MSSKERRIMKHKHHIIPRHMGGSDDPSNLIELTVEEHADAHRILYEKYGKLQDKRAWKILSGKTDESEEIRNEMTRKALKEYFSIPENYQKHVEYGKKHRQMQLDAGGDSEETRKKRSESTKRLIKEGKIKTWRESITREMRLEHFEQVREKLIEGRKNSEIWYDRAHGVEARKKKGESLKKAIERGDFLNDEHKEKIRQSLMKPKDLRLVVVNEKLYIFKKDACRELGISGNALMYRVKSEKYPEYRYAREEEIPEGLDLKKILFSRNSTKKELIEKFKDYLPQ